MTGGLSRWRRFLALAALLAILGPMVSPARGRVLLPDAPPQLSLVVSVPNNPLERYGVDAVQQVVRTTDGGITWSPVLSPGDAQAPDPSSPGSCLPGTYDRVTFLAINPLQPQGLYVGTDGVLGDYLDNGCGNAPGGLFFTPTGVAPFMALNSGLPANADARGGGVAWGVQSITFDSRNPETIYIQTDPSFLAVQGIGQPAYPTGPGVYRSDDGGAQWDAAFGGIAVTSCQFGPCRYSGSLAIDPAQPQVLLLAVPTGLYRTANQGIGWQLIADLLVTNPTHLLTRFDPYDPSLVYVVTDQAIYRSGDGGRHLAQVRASAAPAPAQVVQVSFTRHSPPRVVYTLANGREDVRDDTGSPAAVLAISSPTSTLPVPTPTVPATATPTPSLTMPPTSTSTSTSTSTPTATKTVTPTATASPRPRHTPTPRRPTATPTVTPTPRPTVPSVDEWPMAGHDAGQSFADPAGGVAPGAVPRLRLRWALAGAAPAIEAAGTLYALTSSQKVMALNPKTGATRHRYLSVGVQGLAQAGRLVYFNLGPQIRYVDDRTADWKHTATDKQSNLVPAFNAMVVSGRALYTGVGAPNASNLARAYAFDAGTGKLLWSLPGNLSSIPCLVGNSVYLSFGGAGAGDTEVLNAQTGTVRHVLRALGTAQWHASGTRVYASVLSGGGNNFTASVRAYSLTGRLLWVGHDLLFGAALPGRMFGVTPTAIDARSALDGRRLWRRTIPGLHAIAPGAVVVAGNLLLVQARSGGITILDTGNGHILGLLQPPSPAAAAGNLIVGGGMVYESVTPRAAGARPPSPELLAFGL